jgi:hypothetical protein
MTCDQPTVRVKAMIRVRVRVKLRVSVRCYVIKVVPDSFKIRVFCVKWSHIRVIFDTDIP